MEVSAQEIAVFARHDGALALDADATWPPYDVIRHVTEPSHLRSVPSPIFAYLITTIIMASKSGFCLFFITVTLIASVHI